MPAAAIVPYFVTVILTYHGVTEEALSVDHQHEHHDVVSHASEDAGSGVENDLSLVIKYNKIEDNIFFTFYENKDNSTSQCLGDVSRTAQYFRLLKVARIVKTLRIIRIFKLGICSQKYLPLRNISVSKSSVASHRSSYAIQSLLALV